MKKQNKTVLFAKITAITFLFSSIALMLGNINEQKQKSYQVQEVTSQTFPIKLNEDLGSLLDEQITAIAPTNEYTTSSVVPVRRNDESTSNPQAANTNSNTSTDNYVSGSVSSSQGNPFYQQKMFIDKSYHIQNQLESWQRDRPQDAEKVKLIADNAGSKWVVGGSANDAYNQVNDYVSRASQQNAVAVLVAYNIPIRDCNSYSSGGAGSAGDYNAWIDSFARGIGNRKAAVILEPDAIVAMDCLSSDKQQERVNLVSAAVNRLKQNSNTSVYIDAGHSSWIGATEMAIRLKKANINQADGFALNVSNFQKTNESIRYGEQVAALTNNKHFVVDTSRNGLGPTNDNQWCNPSGRALGSLPTYQTGHPLVDALLWIKVPGESDGSCNGGPSAGVWWPEYALGLVSNYLTYVTKSPLLISTNSNPVETQPESETKAQENPSQKISNSDLNSQLSEVIQQQNESSPIWEVKSWTNESLLQSGKNIILNSAVKANVQGSVNSTLVDIEIYNENGEKVGQQYFEGQNFEAGVAKQFSVLWKASNAGKYIVKVGVFTKEWRRNLVWNENSLEMNIRSASTLESRNEQTTDSNKIEIWWPEDQSKISGTQPFKALVSGLELDKYNLYWQVDNGRLNLMKDSQEDYPHKEIEVNLTNWTWRKDSTYKVKFTAKDLTGKVFAEKEIRLIAN